MSSHHQKNSTINMLKKKHCRGSLNLLFVQTPGPAVPLLRAWGEDGWEDASGGPSGSVRRGSSLWGQEEANQRPAHTHQWPCERLNKFFFIPKRYRIDLILNTFPEPMWPRKWLMFVSNSHVFVGILPRSWCRYTVPASITVIQWVADFSERIKQLQQISQAAAGGGAKELKVEFLFKKKKK